MTEVTLLNKKTAFSKEGPSYFFKIILLGALGAISAFGFGWALRLFFYSHGFGIIGWVVALAGIFLILFLLQSIFIGDGGKSALIVFIESVALSLVFLMDSYYIFPVILAVFFILWWARYSGRVVLNNTLKADFWHLSRAILPKAIMAIALIVSVFSPVYLKAKASGFPFSPGLFEGVVASSKGIIQQFFPEVDPNSSIDQIAQKIAEKQVAQTPGVNNLPNAFKEQIIKQSSSAFFAQISDFIGAPVDPNLNPAQVLYEYAKNKFLQLSADAKNLIFIIIGALIFISIETLSLPIRLVITFFGFLFFKFLLLIGFAKISIEEKPKEVIIME